jgi:hypothetical protein
MEISEQFIQVTWVQVPLESAILMRKKLVQNTSRVLDLVSQPTHLFLFGTKLGFASHSISNETCENWTLLSGTLLPLMSISDEKLTVRSCFFLLLLFPSFGLLWRSLFNESNSMSLEDELADVELLMLKAIVV